VNYRKRILVLGCSFSAGSYIWDDSNVLYHYVKQPDGTTKKIDSGVGREQIVWQTPWIKWLDPQYHYTVYACPGGGIVQHSRVVEELYQEGLLEQYDYVLYQTTFEPRLCFTDPGSNRHQIYENPMDGLRGSEPGPDNIDMYITQGSEKGRIINFLNSYGNNANLGGNFAIKSEDGEWVRRLFSGMTNRHVMNSCAALLNFRLKQLNIPLYIFKYGKFLEENTPQFDDGIVLDVPYAWGEGADTMGIWMKKRYQVLGWIDPEVSRDGSDLFVGHYKESGNKIIGNHVRKALRKYQ